MAGIIGKKIGMTSVYSAEGKNLPCTIIEAGPCVVTQIKTQDKDGYESVQLGFDDKKEKNTPKAMLGHFAKAKTAPKRKMVEFKEIQDLRDPGIWDWEFEARIVEHWRAQTEHAKRRSAEGRRTKSQPAEGCSELQK